MPDSAFVSNALVTALASVSAAVLKLRKTVFGQQKSPIKSGFSRGTLFRTLLMSVGYKKDIFAVFAYEFELSQILNL